MSDQWDGAVDVRRQFERVIERFNAGEDDALLSMFAEDMTFAAPMLQGDHDQDGGWGAGKAGFRDYVLLYREKHGRMSLVDIFAAGRLVSVLIDDERGNRIEFCNELGDDGLISRVFAFRVRHLAGAPAA